LLAADTGFINSYNENESNFYMECCRQWQVSPARAGFGGKIPKGEPSFQGRIPASVGNVRTCPVQTVLGAILDSNGVVHRFSLSNVH
jgi:hypothetical protein